ncbi:MAG TPA: serine hydrolase domain-containing protein [Hyphomicrobiaceae bacterium]|jgi:CubicO group peptidase (beta-lactamase class C family)|nr:serine hydrolase domain-containing protein [Hyphomicrobiaceae bacterium]
MAKEAAARNSAIDKILARAAETGEVPGVVAMATDRDGSIYEGAFGKRVLGQPAAMSPDTVAWIASMTKAITGAAAMQLVEQGKLDLDAPAAAVVSELEQAQVLEGFDAAGQPKLRPPKRPITLRHLLTHTAGFGYEIWNGDVAAYQTAKNVPGIISCQNAALQTPLLFDPGEKWYYGINIDWAGKMVEAVSGKRLGAYMQEHLFAPLGMTSTAFKIAPTMRERLAKIHQRGDDDVLTPLLDLEIPQDAEFDMGGGGLYSTAGDYLKFVRMILNRGKANGEQVLSPETVDQMARNNMGDARVSLLKTVAPTLSNDAEFFPGMSKTWGLSFQINDEAAPTGRPAGGLMWAGLANSYYWIDPTTGIGGVYLTQVLPFADKKALPLYYAFETAFYS